MQSKSLICYLPHTQLLYTNILIFFIFNHFPTFGHLLIYLKDYHITNYNRNTVSKFLNTLCFLPLELGFAPDGQKNSCLLVVSSQIVLSEGFSFTKAGIETNLKQKIKQHKSQKIQFHHKPLQISVSASSNTGWLTRS